MSSTSVANVSAKKIQSRHEFNPNIIMITIMIKLPPAGKMQRLFLFLYYFLFASESTRMLGRSTNELHMIISHKYRIRGPVRTLRGAPGVAWGPSASQRREQTHLRIDQNPIIRSKIELGHTAQLWESRIQSLDSRFLNLVRIGSRSCDPLKKITTFFARPLGCKMPQK